MKTSLLGIFFSLGAMNGLATGNITIFTWIGVFFLGWHFAWLIKN